ncbi:phasin family protein [Motiliproteus sp. MSK22-1]|uniref:phasin family protein n=1 Tax=Motiliproteus sp. MSK22-1 TaxID=1897630 RepID=UPI00097679FD|nr:phasin family protein [Motiliproteus sp. MSK22-1]OMH26630.1 hypothetical protein BGP75_23320 [Motiliproteus sp. MSK22-1]
MFNNISATDFSSFAAPIQKIVDLNTATLTKVFEAQQAAAKKQMSLSQARAKAAMEIKDVEGFTAFITEQSEIAKSSMQDLTESTQTAAKDAKAYFAEVQAILTESQEVVAKAVPALTPAAPKAA